LNNDPIMKNSEIKDPLFLQAVEAIDAGNIPVLTQLLSETPSLVTKRSSVPAEGYFKNPYLLWFVADNPIRVERLPSNIVEVTKLIIGFIEKQSPVTLLKQLNYALGLVATGKVPKDCGVQIALIDLLLEKGASTGNIVGVLAHGNPGAAKHLIGKGAPLTLTVAICLGMKDEVNDLFLASDKVEKELALVAASFFGKADYVEYLIQHGVNVNRYPRSSSGFHSHASALHQAVYSGSLACVKILVDAGADLSAKDKIYDGTPLGWAQYMHAGDESQSRKQSYLEIEKFLQSKLKTTL